MKSRDPLSLLDPPTHNPKHEVDWEEIDAMFKAADTDESGKLEFVESCCTAAVCFSDHG